MKKTKLIAKSYKQDYLYFVVNLEEKVPSHPPYSQPYQSSDKE